MASNSDEPTVASLTSWLVHGLFEDLITDIAIEEHHLAWKRRYRMSLARPAQWAAASTSNSSSLLAPPSSAGLSQASSSSSSRPSSPAMGHSANSTNKKDKDDAALLDCLNCARQIAAPRYAQHLSGCMGLTGGRARGRAAANGGQNPLTKPPMNGVASLGPGSDRASSYASDEETIRRNGIKLNGGTKRASTTSGNGSYRPKKQRTGEPVTAFTNPQLAQTASHPLSKTYSAPSAVSRPTHEISASSTASAPPLASAPMAARASFSSAAAAPSATIASGSLYATKAPRSKAPAVTKAMQATGTIDLTSDRPDSDSEDSDDDTAATRNKQLGVNDSSRHHHGRNGNGGQSQAGSTTNKSPRKAMPLPSFGKKADSLARPADSDSGSSASGSDSD